jgi:hypothetical protein
MATRVAHDLLDAPFAHVAVAAEHLQAFAGAVKRLVVQAAFSTGVTRLHQRFAASRRFSSGWWRAMSSSSAVW